MLQDPDNDDDPVVKQRRGRLAAAAPAEPGSQPEPTDFQLDQLFSAVHEHGEFGRGFREDARRILRSAPQPEPVNARSDADIKALYVKQHGTDAGWLGIEGSYFIAGVQAAAEAAQAHPAGMPLTAPTTCPTHKTSSGDHTICRRCLESWPSGSDRACVRAIDLVRRATGSNT